VENTVSTKTRGLFGPNPARPGWADTEWAVWISGSDDILDQPDVETALRAAAEYNAACCDQYDGDPLTPVMHAVVLHWGYAWTQQSEHAHHRDCGLQTCNPCATKRTAPTETPSGTGPSSTQQTVCHIAVCGACGYAWDEDGEYGTYHYSSPDEAIRGATSEDPEYAFTQLPDGSLLCRRSDRAHQELLGAVLAAEAETRLHQQLADGGQERVATVTDHPHPHS
jgi:hypothetical protein